MIGEACRSLGNDGACPGRAMELSGVEVGEASDARGALDANGRA